MHIAKAWHMKTQHSMYLFRPSFPYQQTVPSGKLWTQEEDALVLRHCSAEKNFSNWSGLATKHLPDRTGKQIRDVSSIAFRGLSVEGIHGRFRLHHSHIMIYSPLSLIFFLDRDGITTSIHPSITKRGQTPKTCVYGMHTRSLGRSGQVSVSRSFTQLGVKTSWRIAFTVLASRNLSKRSSARMRMKMPSMRQFRRFTRLQQILLLLVTGVGRSDLCLVLLLLLLLLIPPRRSS